MNIIITGASRGIGYELVRQLSADPANKVMAVARSADKLEQLKQDCLAANAGAIVLPVVCNLEDEAQVSQLEAAVREHFGRINILVNNAGAIVNKPFMELTAEDFRKVYTVNVFSAARLIREMLPLMDQGRRGHVVNISSMGGFQGSAKFAGLSAYSSSKAALCCLTECLAEEFREKNIAFNCLALGAAQTEMLENAFPGYKAPLSASEMAAFIAGFAVSAQLYMNGKIIPVSAATP